MSQQGLRQASVRAVSGTTLTYEGDWHAMWNSQSIAAGTFNERMLRYINQKLSTSYTEINGAMQALAVSTGATNFGSMGTFTASLSPSYEAETDTLVAAMSVAPDATRKGHINTLIAALKTNGLWTKIDILYVMAAHDAQAARLNWKLPGTNTMTATNSPVFTTDRGYTGDGVSAFLATAYSPSTQAVALSQNSAHMGFWSRTDLLEVKTHMGFHATNAHIYARYTGEKFIGRLNGTHAGVNTTSSLGLLIADRPNSSTNFGYRNGASLGSIATTSVAIPAGTVNVLNYVTYGTLQLAAATLGSSLTAGEHVTYYNAMQAYMTAVGA